MSDDNTRDAAEPSLASGGSHGDAALWALAWNEDAGRIDPEWVYGTREEATEVNETGCYGRATVTPLYRQPQPTLTDAERERIGIVAEWASDHLGKDDPGVVALCAWLNRVDPNKVILDGEQSDAIIGAQAAEIRRLRLTEEEREAIRRLAPSGDPLASRTVTLTPDVRKVFHGLLERLG